MLTSFLVLRADIDMRTVLVESLEGDSKSAINKNHGFLECELVALLDKLYWQTDTHVNCK